jgi:Holliday junction resolvase RusA-like endonuclease
VIPFEFTVAGPPVSQQARRRGRLHEWRARVRAAAAATWPAQDPPFDGPVEFLMTYYYKVVAPDVGNIAKPIEDALNGLVYADDGQIVREINQKRKLDGSLRLQDPSVILATAVEADSEFIHVIVREPVD